MFSLFTSKINGALTLAQQHLSQGLGKTFEAAASALDATHRGLTSLSKPLVDHLTDLPVVGNIVESVKDFKDNQVGNAIESLHSISDAYESTNLAGGTAVLLKEKTTFLGNTINELVDLTQDKIDALAPVTDKLSTLPIIGQLIDVAEQTNENLLGFATDKADEILDFDPVTWIGATLNNPIASLGDTLISKAEDLDALLDDLSPVSDLVAQIPVVGLFAQHDQYHAEHLPPVLEHIGSHLQQAPSISEVLDWLI